MAAVTRCDGCGVERTTSAGWVRLIVLNGQSMLEAMAAGLTMAASTVDLCSWKCAADFATLKALDPEAA